MIDIHLHIIPGVDDGARDMDMALDMADLAVQGGTRIVVATPHADLDNYRGHFENYFDDRFYRRLTAFRRAVEEEGIPLTVLSGQEIYTNFDVLEKIEDGILIPLNHSRYYLMEFPFDLDPREMQKRLYKVRETGRIPIVAHPERYYGLQDRPEYLYRWCEKGCLAQINKGSLLGRFGDECQEAVDTFIEHGLVTCVASDAHSSAYRTPYMGEVQDYLEENYSYDFAKKLLYDNPRRIIEDRAVPFEGRND